MSYPYQSRYGSGYNRQSYTSASSVLGEDVNTNPRQLVTLEQEQRLKGLYVIGKTGSGKTTLLVNMILQDIENGLGVCFFDTHGDAITDILKRLPPYREKDVILLDLQDIQHPFGLNLFECDNPTDELAVQYVVDQVMHIFEKLFGVSHDTPLILEYLRNCTYALIVNQGYTMAEIPFLLQDDESRRKLVTNVTDPDVVLFWRGYEQMRLNDRNAETASILRRVREFLQPLTRPIVGQAKTTIDMRHIMDNRKILLVKLDARLDAVTSLIGSVIIALLLNAAYSRKNLTFKERIQFNLYADEFQRFATEDFATLLEEARKFGIATTIAHQFRNQLDVRNKGATLNAGNLVVYEVSGEDAHELAGQFKITPQEAWEEELEEESVEVTKEEWFEPKIDVIEDGVEEITTPVTNVVGYLLGARGSHPNPVVNRFATTTLAECDRDSGKKHVLHTTLNALFYEAMVHKNTTQAFPIQMVMGLYFAPDIIPYNDEVITNPPYVLTQLLSATDKRAMEAAYHTLESVVRERIKKEELSLFNSKKREIEHDRSSEELNKQIEEDNRNFSYRYGIKPIEIKGVTDWKQHYQYRVERDDILLRPWYRLLSSTCYT